MKLFRRTRGGNSYGAIIDIGSGSVLVAIVHSNPNQSHPHIVWSHREQAPLKNIDSLEQSAKAVMTALVNASMLLDAHGREALRSYDSAARLSHMQCGIGAPWSYTVTKTLNYTQETSFTITEELIDELTRAVQDKISTELEANETLQQLGLQVIDRKPMDMLTNGYRVADPVGEEASQFLLAHANAVTQQHLIDAIEEMHEKLLPDTKMNMTSFALIFHTVTRDIFPNIFDVCLLDITYEATEIGIVRDGVLRYCTHTPFGLYSLVREISTITKVPLAEAYGYLQSEKPYAFMESLPATQVNEIEKVFENYTEKLAELLKETGDELSIPKHISIHTDRYCEGLFVDVVKKAVKRTVKSDPLVKPITGEIISSLYTETTKDGSIKTPKDTALLLSAQFFHITQRG